ncbi:hypothetical protein [Seleniivibrio woodruffii]|uniref:Glycosyltransferase involved in cell wall biosynthesis n=1 Tax=Seleniivibrio woodruffii TaxID=1078050 RepID=A0A4R1KGA2_9BACT|nr:hypothetical protein [Seleniivibrio woodruffii]TCK62359.1 hypothetical protein C8D98_0884 [Seleniivibrio woodruffii]TVZ34524.1 hypothetical protein OF66_0109 [Seleniivibrio woodruffii]
MKKILLFSPNNWDSPLKYQRHHLAEYLADQESVECVYFLSKVAVRKLKISDFIKMLFSKLLSRKVSIERKKHDKISIVNYGLIPYQFKILNHFLKKKFFRKIAALNLVADEIVIISYQPFPELLELVERLKPTKFIYISVHDYENMTSVCKEVMKTEQAIIKRADLFSTDSYSLFEKLSGKSVSERVITLAPACPTSVLKKSKDTKYEKNEIRKLIYFGTIANYLDWDFINKAFSDGFRIDFLGYEYDFNLASNLPESKRYDPTDFENAYEIFMQYDAIILPYLIGDRNQHVLPAKIYECFSLGLPVFAPDMLWVKAKDINDFVFTYENFDDFRCKVNSFDMQGFQIIREHMLGVAENNRWEKRFEPLFRFIQESK